MSRRSMFLFSARLPRNTCMLLLINSIREFKYSLRCSNNKNGLQTFWFYRFFHSICRYWRKEWWIFWIFDLVLKFLNELGKNIRKRKNKLPFSYNISLRNGKLQLISFLISKNFGLFSTLKMINFVPDSENHNYAAVSLRNSETRLRKDLRWCLNHSLHMRTDLVNLFPSKS